MANYPTSVSTDANLFLVKNQLATTLNGSITNSQTTITATSTTGFPTAGAITIDSEVIFYTGISSNDFTGCTRGADGTGATTHTSGVAVRHTNVAFHHNGLKDEIIAVETHNLPGQRTGTATNDSAATGKTGEQILGSITSASPVNVTTTAVFQNLTSISLTAGDWDVRGLIVFVANGATIVSEAMALSAFSGDTQTDHVTGINDTTNVGPPPTATFSVSVALPAWRVSLSSTTTIYIKGRVNFSAGTPQMFGAITARRAR